MTRLPNTHDLEGFIDTLELLIKQARRGRLVAASINLDPTALGHYGYKLLDGTAIEADEPTDFTDSTMADTKPGKRQR